jgi:TIR domain
VAKLNVFTSYAHEDQKITDALCAMLEDIFGEDIHVFYDKESLHAGEDIDEKIQEELRKADTMLVISTGAMRASHSWTGFELGFFAATHESKPGVRGKVISICTHDDVPPTEGTRRFVPLNIESELLDVDPVRAGQSIEISDDDELLQFIGDLVLEIMASSLVRRKPAETNAKSKPKTLSSRSLKCSKAGSRRSANHKNSS